MGVHGEGGEGVYHYRHTGRIKMVGTGVGFLSSVLVISSHIPFFVFQVMFFELIFLAY